MTTTTFAVRRATPSDKDEVIALSRAVDEHDFIAEIYDFWMTAEGPDGFYVAEQEGRIIGCYCLELPGPGQAYFYAMRIHPNAQGKGIGSQFCRLQAEQARSLGAEDIFLLSVTDNLRAHRTVEKNGFVNRGAWIIYDGLREIPVQPAPHRARPALAEDGPRVERFRRERATGPLADVISAPYVGWTVKRMMNDDWELANVVVVEGKTGLDGVMLLSDTRDGLLIRWLDGTPEAAADLIAYGVERMGEKGQEALSLSLPQAAEPLLAPLRLDPAAAFRAYVFHLDRSRPLPPVGHE
ncbi:MAG: GNAT family N-acetyltransferase [Bacillota bacterium]